MICAIVLAAGRSERMGTQKLLLPIGGKPLIARIVDELRRCPLQEIIVVVGRDGERLSQALLTRVVRFVPNPDLAGDMLSSMRCGLGAVSAECEAALVVLGDQPGIASEVVGRLIEAFRKSGREIVVPRHHGHRGHPLLIAASLHAELLCQHEGVGLKGLLAAHPDKVLCVDVETAALLEDMDTPQDYQRHFARLVD